MARGAFFAAGAARGCGAGGSAFARAQPPGLPELVATLGNAGQVVPVVPPVGLAGTVVCQSAARSVGDGCGARGETGIGGIGHAVGVVVLVASVPLAVLVEVQLIPVGDRRAIVVIAADPIAVGVVRRILGAQVTDVSAAIAIAIALPRIGRCGAVVDVVRGAIAIGVGNGRSQGGHFDP